MPESLLETWVARGVEIVQGYGLTEAGAERPVPAARGRPAQARLRRASPIRTSTSPSATPRAGRCSTAPATGELVVRGPNVFAGYWRNPEATAAAFADGWLLTGDVAERDEEGFYRIAGRIKEMVISGGENVYPAEIEDVLHAHPAVLEAAVVGVPDERWGEACAAFVVLRDGGSATEDAAPRALPRAARAVQGAEDVRVRRLAAALVDGQGAEGRAARVASRRSRNERRRGDRRRRPALSRSAASARAAGCSRPPSPCSPSSATTTRRS